MKVKTKEDMYKITGSTQLVLSELLKLLNKEISKFQNSKYPTTIMTTNNFIKKNLKKDVISRSVRGGKINNKQRKNVLK